MLIITIILMILLVVIMEAAIIFTTEYESIVSEKVITEVDETWEIKNDSVPNSIRGDFRCY